MEARYQQLGLFDEHKGLDVRARDRARVQMRETIDGLVAMAAPPWTKQIDIIYVEGAFERAMGLVPADEAQALWAEFDREMDRLCDMYPETPPEGEGAT